MDAEGDDAVIATQQMMAIQIQAEMAMTQRNTMVPMLEGEVVAMPQRNTTV